MSRIIMSTESSEGKSIEVTPEAINKFYITPVEVRVVGSEPNQRTIRFEAKLEANTKEPGDIILTLSDDKGRTSTTALNENEFANGMIYSILINHGDIDDVRMLKDAKEMLTGQLAYKIWKEEGIICTSLKVPGFGYIEAQNDVVAVVEGITCTGESEFQAVDGSDITYYGNLGKGHLHFLPEGTDRFLVFDLDVVSSTEKNGEKTFRLDMTKWPAPTKEAPVGAIPKPRTEYKSFEDYIDAVNAYIQKHMGAGNDRRVELEDDLIF